MMEVLYLLTELDPKYGGPTFSVPLQAIGVAKQGINTKILTYSDNSPLANSMEEEGVIMEYVDRPKSKWERFLYGSIRTYLQHYNAPDIYHAHGVWLLCNHWHALYARKNGKAYVVNPRGDLQVKSLTYNKWKLLKKKLAWFLYSKKDLESASCIITTSNQEAAAIRKLNIRTPIAIIPNGIDLHAFPECIIHKHNEKKIALFLGRINPIKGLDYLIDAWVKLPKDILNTWELHIAGNSDPADYEDKLKEQVKRLRLDSNVFFVGQITGAEKLKKYSRSDLFILPSHNENFSNVVVEALMCECPVITTQGTPWKSLSDNKIGWWVELSRDNLQNAIVEAANLTDEQRWEKGKRGRQLVIENYSLDSVSANTVQLYEWVLGRREKPFFVDII